MTTQQRNILESFIMQNRKVCWESEYEQDEQCLGEKKVFLFMQDVFNNPERYGLKKNEQEPQTPVP